MAEEVAGPNPNFILRDTYYLPHSVKVDRDLYEVDGYAIVNQPNPRLNSSFALVTGFEDNVLTTYSLAHMQSVEEAGQYIQKNGVLYEESGMQIRELRVGERNETPVQLYWVGHRAFKTIDDARAAVIQTKANVEALGGDFSTAIESIRKVWKVSAKESVEASKSRPELEEEFLQNLADMTGMNTDFFGPLYGPPYGERILYQSVMEGTYRTTNFEERHFDAYTAFWSHRLVFKGIRFLGDTTIDPFVEVVPAAQTDGDDGDTHLELKAGLEWRPFVRNAYLSNYQPYGVPLLDWLRNLNVFVDYRQRKNIKGRYDDGVKTYDMRAGVALFKEWGVEMPDIYEYHKTGRWFKPNDLFWGEYFMEMYWDKTNFTAGDNLNSFIDSTQAFKIGLKWPRFPLPENPINTDLVLMPYFVFEDARSSDHADFFRNRYYYGWGLRLMPFRDFRFMENEWLFKTKLFVEYLQDIHYTKNKPPGPVPEKDIRLGLNVSLRRF